MGKREYASSLSEPPKTCAQGPSKPGLDLTETSQASRLGVYLFTLAMFVVGFAVGLAATLSWLGAAGVAVALVAALLLASCVRVSAQWERVVVLRFGRFHRVAGPGLFVMIPLVDSVAANVDQRIRIVPFTAEAALTLDLVPVDIDAAIFYVVWDAQKAALEAKDYPKAVLWSAQAALRDAIGRLNLADLSPRRKEIDSELQVQLEEKCEQWGVTVLSVEIRDLTVPQELQDALSREAQAQSERNARLLLSEVECEISEIMAEAAVAYDKSPNAFKLRALNLAYEGAKEGGGMLLTPTDLADGFNVGKVADRG